MTTGINIQRLVRPQQKLCEWRYGYGYESVQMVIIRNIISIFYKLHTPRSFHFYFQDWTCTCVNN